MDDIYDPSEIRLAHEIAERLQDPEALPLYLRYARRYQAPFLRRMLERVMSIEDSKIKKTRGALFTFLINQSGNDSRH